MVYHGEVVLESCLWRGYVPAGKTYTLCYLFAPRAIWRLQLKARARSRSYTLHTTHYTLHTTHYTLHTTHYTLHTTHYTLHTTHYTTALGASHRPVFSHHIQYTNDVILSSEVECILTSVLLSNWMAELFS